MPFSNDPEAVVQRQLDAFNARDIDALLAVYAEDAQMFEHPSKLLASGSAAFRERYMGRFQEPNLHASLLKRIVMGNVVIDHEEVARTFPEGPGKMALIMIYEVQNGRIARGLEYYRRKDAGHKAMKISSHPRRQRPERGEACSPIVS